MSRSRRPNKHRLRRLDPDSFSTCGCWLCITSKTKLRLLRERQGRRERAATRWHVAGA